ncbi:MAG: hypothetical protein VR70_11640 [Rhodospirillaceae bacterium BRH_c57]|nr:MAG: hypothetical protein VR70_11640 [Rhodospirillaceae bacterium BRH_c57]
MIQDIPHTDLPDTAPAAPRPLIIAVAHQKGGSGKTTTTCNLAIALARRMAPQKVAVVDLDPQGSASQHLGMPAATAGTPVRGVYELLTGRLPLSRLLRPTQSEGVMLVPTGPRMTLAEIDPALREISHLHLRKVLSDDNNVACILLDCAPGFGVFTTVSLMAADIVLVPTPPLPFAETALNNTVAYVERLRSDGRSRVGLLMTMVQATDAVQAETLARLRAVWHDHVFAASIPFDAAAERAVTAGLPVVLNEPTSAVARAYEDAAAELYAALGPELERIHNLQDQVAPPPPDEYEAWTQSAPEPGLEPIGEPIRDLGRDAEPEAPPPPTAPRIQPSGGTAEADRQHVFALQKPVPPRQRRRWPWVFLVILLIALAAPFAMVILIQRGILPSDVLASPLLGGLALLVTDIMTTITQML